MDRFPLFHQEKSDLTWAESPPNIAQKNTMKKVNLDELQTLKQNHEWLLVKFSSPACAPCKLMSENINQVAPSFPELNWVEADALENIDELMSFGLGNVVPQTFLYHQGLAVNLEKPYQLVGLKTTEVVDQVLSHFITP
jgi:hypothetical protein